MIKSKYPRTVLNELKWKGYDMSLIEMTILNRGSPNDRAIIKGNRIVSMGTLLTLSGLPYDVVIPYHRIIKITYKALQSIIY